MNLKAVMIHKRIKECLKCGDKFIIYWEDGKGFLEYNLCSKCRVIK